MPKKKLNSEHYFCGCDNEYCCALNFVGAKPKYNLFSLGFRAPNFNSPATCMSGIVLARCRVRDASKPDCPIPLIDLKWTRR